MMRPKQPSLDEIREQLRSPKQTDRVRAMQSLRERAKKDARLAAIALPIFQCAIEAEPDRYTAIYAARGIESAAGPAAGRAAWLALLDRDDADTVATVASAVGADATFAPVLIALLNRRPEMTIRHAVIRALGRMRVPETLPIILDGIGVPELRPDVVQALEDFGDPRAIPYLETLLGDTTDAWEADNHGPTLTVSNVATTAIARLRLGAEAKAVAARPPPPSAAPRTARSVALWLAYVAGGALLARMLTTLL